MRAGRLCSLGARGVRSLHGALQSFVVVIVVIAVRRGRSERGSDAAASAVGFRARRPKGKSWSEREKMRGRFM